MQNIGSLYQNHHKRKENDMARYIDADKLEFESKLLKDNETELTGMNGVALIGRRSGKTIQLYKELFKQMIENAPTEDVVPRSEVERIFDWFDEHLVNLNFLTGNCELNFGDYISFKQMSIGEQICTKKH